VPASRPSRYPSIFDKPIKQFSARHLFAPQDIRIGAAVDARLDGGLQDIGEDIGRDGFGLACLTVEGRNFEMM
jgi:hypothetical protein